jgi:hypothetical protein
MQPAETLFLVLVLASFAVFAAALATASIKSRRLR